MTISTFDRGSLRFEVWKEGLDDGAPVILLHGFPQDAFAWDEIVPRLVQRGFRTFAPFQRGYSARARPPSAAAYVFDELRRDVLALADHEGLERFHLVGHDWGAVVAWVVAGADPERVLTLTSLSIPHPEAYRRAVTTSLQALRSTYIGFFALPGVAERVLGARGGRLLRSLLNGVGVPDRHAERYAERLGSPEAMRTALNWYRALFTSQARWTARPAEVPVLVVRGDRDPSVDPKAFELTAGLVRAPYRLEVIHGAGHWLPERHAAAVGELLLEHLGAP
ncbi:MAG TPA: alpha/beta fold hydrolase [Actinomycetota bacterium]|jgi:pimeloyl-ACP methyl ester carboxylesterase|nr:alpha/beta fold hydrolase [Actinomycetota bacterium]